MALRLRSCVLLAAGALGLHQLRYALAYGPDAGKALRAQGHAYLGPLTGVVVALAILAASVWLHRVATGRQEAAAPRRLARVWLAAAGALLAIYAAQESIEGAVSPGHPAGLSALTGHGGWIAVPLAAAIGLAIALALRGASAASATVAALARRLLGAPSARAPLTVPAPHAPLLRPLPALASAAAGRAPPPAS